MRKYPHILRQLGLEQLLLRDFVVLGPLLGLLQKGAQLLKTTNVERYA